VSTGELREVRLAIIGGGCSGIAMAAQLRAQGIDDFVILERAADLGGTWRDNSYPGCACDVQSSLYSFSFAPNPEWTRTFSPQAEIWAYLRRVVAQLDLHRHFAFNQNVHAARWDEQEARWFISTSAGEWRATALVLASGALSDPIAPALDGLAEFRGRVFHSAHWDHTYVLENARVAVIGTGASAIQFVPRIQPQVAQLHLFQRSAPWVLPRHDRAVPEWRKRMYRSVPATQRAARAALYALRELIFLPFRHTQLVGLAESVARWHLASQVKDASLRLRLTPAYRLGCKRVLVSDDYYPAVAQPNVTLVTQAIARVNATGIETIDGAQHHVDAIIFGTGFRPTDPPLAPYIAGRDGLTLADAWQGSPSAYRGTTVAGFPNFFVLLGPNTGLGHSSILLMVEAQTRHVSQVLAAMEQRGASTVEPTSEAQRTFETWITGNLAGTVWNTGGCRSWYLDANGRNSTLWPFGIGRFRRMMSRLDERDYRFTSAYASPSSP
jgi:cation diffusion facilitator CzcD-associated flavoprotein CzcO